MSAPAPAPVARRFNRLLLAALLLIAAAAALGAGVAWLVATPSGLRAAIALTNRLVPATITASGARGALTREFGFDRLEVSAGNTRVEIRDLRATLRDWSLRPLRFAFDSLAAGRVDVSVTPKADHDGPPTSIASPVAVSARRVAVDEFALQVGAPVLALRAIDAQIELGPDGYRVADGSFRAGDAQITLAGELGGHQPFSLAVRGRAKTALQAHSVQADWQTEGSLLDFVLAANVSGDNARGTAAARITSFDKPALRSLHVDLSGIDLRAWKSDLPLTQLQVRAELQPDAAQTRLRGPVQVVNGAAGTVDVGRVPLRGARGEIDLGREDLRVTNLTAELTRGRLAGSFAATFGAAPTWQADARLEGVDPAAIHSQAKPLLLDGTTRIQTAAGVSAVRADLTNRGKPTVDARLDLRIASDRMDIRRADLLLGAGRASMSGALQLAGARRLSLKGTVEQLDPGLLVKGLDALISGDFEAEAQLAPHPIGQLRFSLAKSRLFGRDLAGQGRLLLDAQQQLDVDAALSVRTATILARGGLGAPDRSLSVSVDVPALDDLVPQWRGALKAQATLSGAWTAPAVDARAVASDVQIGQQSVQQMQAVATYSGGNDGRLLLQAGLANHVFRDHPALSLRTATLVVDGLRSLHTISLHGATQGAQTAALTAKGGIDGHGWRGELSEASLGAPLDLRLLAPSPLTVGMAGYDFGPARFALSDARFEDVRLSGDGNTLQTSGGFNGLRPTALAARDPAASGIVLVAPPTLDVLTLRGQWQLRLGTQADGQLLIERSGGDLYAGADAQSAMHIRDVRIEATLKANRFDASAAIAGDRSGTLNARMSAFVERSPEAGWRLAQQRAWQVRARAELPSLAWINSILSERISSNVRFDGRLSGQANIDGTPAEPRASGSLDGDALRVAWVEQGMRLENGRLRAHLADDVIVLDELHFAGPPRVRPEDSRAAAHLDFTRQGSVSASGRVRVRDLDGVIQVAADHLPLLQRPDRWVIASGGANIETSLKRVQLNGAFAAVAGFVDFSRTELPSLSSDVVVVRTHAEPVPRASRVTLGFDVGIDLGDAFYIRGNGLNTRVEGAVRLRSAGRGAVTAAGSIEAQDGIYEGFGQRLAIVRGRLNFQGPPDNPGLDVLAVRRGLPVDVGVTITRTASDPLVRLYSDPPLSDYEALSWLVLGRPPDQTRGDNLALAQAAAGLLSGSGPGIPGELARTLGIDEITLRSGDVRDAGSLLPRRSVAGSLRGGSLVTTSASSEIITIGKRVGNAITVSYEQALAGTASVVQLSYQLSQRLSLVARAGTENALDLVYSIAFD